MYNLQEDIIEYIYKILHKELLIKTLKERSYRASPVNTHRKRAQAEGSSKCMMGIAK